jgi:hypothetical protein
MSADCQCVLHPLSRTWRRRPTIPEPTDDVLAQMLTPEDVCIHESMLAHNQRLHDVGVVEKSDTKEDSIKDILDRIDELEDESSAFLDFFCLVLFFAAVFDCSDTVFGLFGYIRMLAIASRSLTRKKKN